MGEGRKQDHTFFATMREGMERGGYRCLLRYLLDYDLTGLDFNAAPQTQALVDQKHHSLDPFHQWWYACLVDGRIVGAEFTDWPIEIECERFRAAFRRHIKERNIHSWLHEDRIIGRLMKQCAPSVYKKRLSKREDGQPYAYRLPAIEVVRGEWDVFIGHPAEFEL